MLRKLFVIGAVLLVLAHAGRPWRADAQELVDRPENARRATAAYRAMLGSFALPDLPLLREAVPQGDANPYAYQWPFSQAISATLAMAGGDTDRRYAHDLEERMRALHYYWDVSSAPPAYNSYILPPFGHGGDVFYDDNAWTGLQLIQHYRMTGYWFSLQQARAVFDFLVSGWDPDPTRPAPGGIFWVRADWNRERNTVSTAPAAQLGLHLYEITREPFYLHWGSVMYNWVNTYMLAPNGLYWDRISVDGRINEEQWSYNQGSMIGASVLLYRITADTAYLHRAETIVESALRTYGREGFIRQDPAFNAIFFKYLLLLASVNGNTAYRAAMQEYADYLWAAMYDPVTGLAKPGADHRLRLLDQTVIVQLYAYLAWDPIRYSLLG